jgi:phage RecT family recombinase
MPDDNGRQLTVIEQHFKPLMPEIEDALAGSGIAPRAMMQKIIWALADNPTLLECPKESLLRFGMTTVALALQPDPKMGQIFAIPFRDKRRGGQKVAQTITGYKGYNTLAHRDRISLGGNVVREGDRFEFEEGTGGYVIHVRTLGHWATKPIIAAYATATAVGFTPRVKIMDIDEIEDVKGRSPGAGMSDSPWNDPRIGYAAMCIKTPKRRLATRDLPFGAVVLAATMDEAHEERGLTSWIEPRRGLIVDGERADLPGRQPDPSEEDRAKLGVAPKFPIHKNTLVFNCATIDEWRGKMEIAVKAVKSLATLELFHDKNHDAMEELRREFPAPVGAIRKLIKERLRELGA